MEVMVVMMSCQDRLKENTKAASLRPSSYFFLKLDTYMCAHVHTHTHNSLRAYTQNGDESALNPQLFSKLK